MVDGLLSACYELLHVIFFQYSGRSRWKELRTRTLIFPKKTSVFSNLLIVRCLMMSSDIEPTQMEVKSKSIDSNSDHPSMMLDPIKKESKKLVEDSDQKPREDSTVMQTLSFVWFALCTSLVTKHNDLVAVFCSFAGSLFVVVAISLILGRDLKASTIGAFCGEVLSTSQRRDNVRTKAYTGILACAASLALVGFGSSASAPFKLNRLIMKSPEFHALANVAGFLAFDLWYDRLCCRQFPPRLLSILEDALTLSWFSVILTNWDAWDTPSCISTSKFYISVWLGYKLFSFIFDIIGHYQTETKFREDDANTNVVSKEHIWTVHGKDYDFKEFVNRHPGGKEAILLGRGRDCTALFESYHPFTHRHRYVISTIFG